MRKCYACQQMSGVVTVVKKPDGKRGVICSKCYHPEQEKPKPTLLPDYWTAQITPQDRNALYLLYGGEGATPLTNEELQEMEGCGA